MIVWRIRCLRCCCSFSSSSRRWRSSPSQQPITSLAASESLPRCCSRLLCCFRAAAAWALQTNPQVWHGLKRFESMIMTSAASVSTADEWEMIEEIHRHNFLWSAGDMRLLSNGCSEDSTELSVSSLSQTIKTTALNSDHTKCRSGFVVDFYIIRKN